MHPFDSPLHTLGPGSQPAEPDGVELDYLPMPKAMRAYEPSSWPDPEAAGACPRGLCFLERLLTQLRSYRILEPTRVLDLLDLPEPDRDLVTQALGEGEVGILFGADVGARIQETRLAGVWRVRYRDERGQVTRDEIEVADIPGLVRETAFRDALRSVELDGEMPEGVLTARSVLAELNAHSASWRLGDWPHVINLTLLPNSPADLAYLDSRLGLGPLTILSRGYGNCRITATGLLHGWRVQHFNSDDKLILDTFEVVEVPAAALAAREDIEDSAERLAEILQAVR